MAVGATERERQRETRNGGGSLAWWLHWPKVVAAGQRWSTVAGGCGGSGCSGERESGRSCRGADMGKKKGSRILNPK